MTAIDARGALAGVSVLVPVRVDSEERLRNLHDLLTRQLAGCLADQVVVECDERPRARDLAVAVGARYGFVHRDASDGFPKAALLNAAAAHAREPVLCLHDVDVVVSRAQYAAAARRARGGECLVLPYDGRYVDVPEARRGDVLAGAGPEGLRIVWDQAVGGVVFARRSAWDDAGGMNPAFVSWGPEDVEFVERMARLGHPAGRVAGPLYHFAHPRPPDSSPRHARFDDNVAERLRVKALSDAELRQMVRTWARYDRTAGLLVEWEHPG